MMHWIGDKNQFYNISLLLLLFISQSDPYAMEKEVADGLKGNDRYEGFGIDIIDELSKLYGFKYEFVLQTDGNNGKVIDPETNTWDGMIGEVQAGVSIPSTISLVFISIYSLKISSVKQRADLAITDLTINSDRITALDFTPSFLNLGNGKMKKVTTNHNYFECCRYCAVVSKAYARATVYILFHVSIFIDCLDLPWCSVHHCFAMFLLSWSYISESMGKSLPL